MYSRRAAVIVTVLAAAIVLPACNRKKSYDSPQAVFDAATAAASKEDWPAFMNCLTDDSQDKFTFGVAFGAMMMKGFAAIDKDKGKDVSDAIDAALKKHGMTEAHMQEIGKGMVDLKGPKQSEKETLKKAIAPIKDKPAFVADVMAALKKLGSKDTQEKFGGTLKDLKIEGDKATAKVTRTMGGKETQEPIEFRKVDGGWKIELPDDGPFGGAGPK
jgi:hypothetical protein